MRNVLCSTVRDQICGIGARVVINDENVIPVRRRVETVG